MFSFQQLLYLEGISLFQDTELQEMIDLMTEKEIRIRIPVEEVDLLLAAAKEEVSSLPETIKEDTNESDIADDQIPMISVTEGQDQVKEEPFEFKEKSVEIKIEAEINSTEDQRNLLDNETISRDFNEKTSNFKRNEQSDIENVVEEKLKHMRNVKYE